MLSKRKDKSTLDASYTNVKLKEFPKATPEQLKEIRERIHRENKQTRIKQLLLFGVLFTILLIVFLYLIH